MANGNNTGRLKIQITNSNLYIPISNADIEISLQGAPDEVIEKVTTDENGITENIELEAPPFRIQHVTL